MEVEHHLVDNIWKHTTLKHTKVCRTQVFLSALNICIWWKVRDYFWGKGLPTWIGVDTGLKRWQIHHLSHSLCVSCQSNKQVHTCLCRIILLFLKSCDHFIRPGCNLRGPVKKCSASWQTLGNSSHISSQLFYLLFKIEINLIIGYKSYV